MLRKLLWHDMKTMSRSCLPLLLTALAVSVVCCALLFFGISSIASDIEGGSDVFLVVGIMTSIGFYALGITGIAVLCSLVNLMAIVRYYKSIFTDEGYLNMVLPVKPSTMFNSKIISTLIWAVISGCTLGVAFTVGIVVPIVIYDPAVLLEIAQIINAMMYLFTPETMTVAISPILDIITLIFTGLENVFIIITAVTLGGVIIKKHKILGAVGFYFAITFIQESIVGLFRFLVTLSLATHGSLGYLSASIFNLVLTVVIVVVLYVVNYYVLNKKFNIE